MCPVCGSDIIIDFVDRIAKKDIAQFIEKCSECPYRLSITEFNAEYYDEAEDFLDT